MFDVMATLRQKSFKLKELHCSYSTIDIQPFENPFFKRLWTVKHILDEDSPLLSPCVRRDLRKNGGSWPPELNSYEGIRSALKFDHIVVNLVGTSNISAAHVFSQKIYDRLALCV